jgi:hypothetical protein
MVGLVWHHPLAEARKCVEAAEMLSSRARSLGVTCSAGRRACLWLAFSWHVERATSLVEEVKRERADRRRPYLVKEARIALIAASRP